MLGIRLCDSAHDGVSNGPHCSRHAGTTTLFRRMAEGSRVNVRTKQSWAMKMFPCGAYAAMEACAEMKNAERPAREGQRHSA
jgi:hypothetical protein